MNIFFYMVIPILMHFCVCLQLKSLFRLKLECCKLHAIKQSLRLLMISDCYGQYITGILSQISNIIQLMHSFEVDIRICQSENSDVHRGEAEVNITFEG